MPRGLYTDGATGGSTNAIVHLLAIVGRLGLDLRLDDFDRIGAGVPLPRAAGHPAVAGSEGANSSMRLPSGSASRIWRPPGPVTRLLRNCRSASRRRVMVASRSSTTR